MKGQWSDALLYVGGNCEYERANPFLTAISSARLEMQPTCQSEIDKLQIVNYFCHSHFIL